MCACDLGADTYANAPASAHLSAQMKSPKADSRDLPDALPLTHWPVPHLVS